MIAMTMRQWRSPVELRTAVIMMQLSSIGIRALAQLAVRASPAGAACQLG